MSKIGFFTISMICFLLVAWTISYFYLLGLVGLVLLISWILRFSYSFFTVKNRISNEGNSNEITDGIFHSIDLRPMCYFLGIFHLLFWLLLVERLSVLDISYVYILAIPFAVVIMSESFGILGSISIRLFYLKQNEKGVILESLVAQ
jgi:hypothetical protein